MEYKLIIKPVSLPLQHIIDIHLTVGVLQGRDNSSKTKKPVLITSKHNPLVFSLFMFFRSGIMREGILFCSQFNREEKCDVKLPW